MDEQDRAYQEQRRRKTRKRTIRNVTVLVILVLVLIALFTVKIFIVPQSEIKNMDYIELYAEDGETVTLRIDVDDAQWSYKADKLIWKGEIAQGRVVMKNGSSYPLNYALYYDVFVTEKHGGYYYQITE